MPYRPFESAHVVIGRQFLRYAVIGLLMNAALYLAYLGLTASLLSSRPAMSITYVAGVLIGFLLNRRITFAYSGPGAAALVRYAVTYVIGYLINFITLWQLVDRWGLPHQIVQGCVTLALPVLLFLLQRFWVFPSAPSRLPESLAP